MHKIYVTTCPKYMEVLKVWLYLCNKFWQPNPEVVILGNGACTIALPDNATFINVGNDANKDLWCKNMGDYFASINEEYIAITMEDCWITQPVNTEQYDAILKEVQRLKIDRTYINRSYADLPKIREHCKNAQNTWGAYSEVLYAKNPQSYYFISLHASFWKRTRFVELCRECSTPWQMEVQGSVYARSHGFKCGIPYGPSPLKQEDMILKYRDPGGPDHLRLSTIPPAVLKDLKDNGMLDHWLHNGSMDMEI